MMETVIAAKTLQNHKITYLSTYRYVKSYNLVYLVKSGSSYNQLKTEPFYGSWNKERGV